QHVHVHPHVVARGGFAPAASAREDFFGQSHKGANISLACEALQMEIAAGVCRARIAAARETLNAVRKLEQFPAGEEKHRATSATKHNGTEKEQSADGADFRRGLLISRKAAESQKEGSKSIGALED